VAREIAVLTNPTAGKGRGSRHAAVAVPCLRQAGFTVREMVSRDGTDALDLARKAVADGVGTLVVCGGDGMVHIAAQAVADTDVTLGVIPAGTGNDVARYLGIPRRDPRAAADVVIGSRTRTIDLGRCGGTYFVTVMAAGFDSKVNERANRMSWPRGQMRYDLATIAELRVFQPLRYVVDLDGKEHRLEAMLVAVANGPSFGGGLRIAEGAALDDGLVDVVVIRPMTKRRLVAAYPRLFSGTVAQVPEYEHHRVSSVTVASPDVVAYADGERLGPLPLTVEAVPRALRVLSPA
jgi:diacylglycerol kinase (ATP)